jgi:hypothetical protein
VFRRRRRDRDEPDRPEEGAGPLTGDEYDDAAAEATDNLAAAADLIGAGTAPATLAGGPYDVSESPDDDVPRLDLGGMQVPVAPDMEVRVDVAEDKVVAATVVLRDSAVQLQPFAAPKSRGLWEELRAEIAAGLTSSGGRAEEGEGALGTELRAGVPVPGADGRTTVQAARFVGADGPRWFLRGVFTGRAAVDPERAAPLEAVFRGVVVVRGDQPMPPREPLGLRLPDDAGAALPPELGGEQSTTDQRSGEGPTGPLRRGPEITETR